MEQLFLIAHVCIAIAIVGLVLIQQGKGAEIGAAFGGGASGTFFGSTGATSFLIKLTAGLALCFFVTSLSLGYMASKRISTDGRATLSERISKVQPANGVETVETAEPVVGDVPAIGEKKSVDDN